MSKKKTTTTPILILGSTGTGKSFSVGNYIDTDTGKEVKHGLNPSETLIANTEKQALPISNYNDFMNITVKNYDKLLSIVNELIDVKDMKEKEYVEYLKYVKENDFLDFTKVKYLVIESLSDTSKILFQKMLAIHDKWTAYDEYQFAMTGLIDKLKDLDIQVFIFGRTEQKVDGIDKREFFKPHGVKLKFGEIESQFVIVLFSIPVYNEEGDHVYSYLKYKSNRFNTAKTPPGMFIGEIRNDLNLLSEGVKKYYARSK